MARTLLLLFLGQLVSLDLALISFTVSLINNQGVDAAMSVSFFSYLSLAAVYGSILLYRSQKLQLSWDTHRYHGIGMFHLPLLMCRETILLQKLMSTLYTSITSVTLLDCCTIVWVIVLTWLLLGTCYATWQVFGVGVCLLGLVLVVLSDYDPIAQGGSNPLFGDVIVIAATVFLAMSNVGVEFCVKKKDRVEVMAMIGVFGMLITGAGMATFERKSLQSITWSPQLVLAYVGCTAASFMLYTLVPLVLKMSGATMFNLSLLTSDMWVLLIRIFFYKQQVKWLYYPAYALVIMGIYIYLMKGNDEAIDIVNDGYSIVEEEKAHVGDGNVVHDASIF